MEMTLDMKGLKNSCTCGSGKLAGVCHRKDESCPCGSGEAVSKCHLKENDKKTSTVN